MRDQVKVPNTDASFAIPKSVETSSFQAERSQPIISQRSRSRCTESIFFNGENKGHKVQKRLKKPNIVSLEDYRTNSKERRESNKYQLKGTFPDDLIGPFQKLLYTTTQ